MNINITSLFKVKSSPPLGSAADHTEWRERLFKFICIATATVHLSAPFLYWAIVGAPGHITGTIVAVGLVAGVLPVITLLSVRARCWLLCLGLMISVVSIGATRGFGSAFSGAFPLLLITTGLLLGRLAMALVVALAFTGFLVAGYAIDTGHLSIDTSGHDPGVMLNWVSAIAVFSAICLATVAIVRFATHVVDDGYARVRRELAQARQLRKAAERVRMTRLSVERELRGVQKIEAVGQLTGGLAHLFNNALTVMRSALETVQADSSLQNRIRTREQVHTAFDGTLRATSDLMIFSRRDEPKAELIKLSAALEEFADMHSHAVPNDVDLRVDAVQDLEIMFDPKSFKQMLLNLVLNATEAVRTSGEIRVTAALFKGEGEQEITRAVLAIEDNGCGMSQEALARAVDPFYTNDTTRSGLGLSVAHAIADQAGGELRLESDENAGTRVLVLLPLASPISIANTDSAKIWPTAHALHQNTLGRHHESLVTDANWADEPQVTPAWQGEVTRRLARVTTIVFVTILAAVATILPHMVWIFLLVGVPAVAFTAVSGWMMRLPQRLALMLLVTGLAWIGVGMVFTTSFTLVSAMIAIATAVIWAALLGGRWDGPVALLCITAALLLSGYLRSGPVSLPLLSNGDMDLAANWYRFAPQVALFGLILSRSVVGVLSHTARGAVAEKLALNRVETMRLREAEEGARLLEIETRRNLSERSEVAGQAAGTVIHDLRNAIHALMMSSELLAEERLSEKQIDEAIATLGDAVGYAEALATQFDSAAPGNTNSGHRPICDLTVSVETAITLLRRILPGSINIVTDLQTGAAVRIGEMELRRLLFNFVTNARDAIYGKGTITVSLRVNNGVVALGVRDTGCGIDDTHLGKIFEPFFTTKKRGMGTGLGLHLVAGIITDSNGRLEVESDVGKGTSFVVTWPAEAVPTEVPQPTDRISTAKSEGTILLAEDEHAVRKVMAEAIRRSGFDVVEASDGDQGKKLAIETAGFVAACIDGVMPGAPTSEVIDAFLKHHPGRPVLLCSGYMPSDLASRDLMRPGVTFVAKPFGPARLIKELKAVIRNTEDTPETSV